MLVCIQTGDIVDRLGIAEGYKAIKECGFDAVDWNLDHAWRGRDIRELDYEGKSIMEKPLNEVIAYYADELAVIKKNNLVISQAHAPFPCYVQGHEEVLDYAIKVYERNIEYCDYADCKNLVIHGINYSLSDYDNTPAEIDRLNRKLYFSLVPVLKRTKVTVCLENTFTGFNGVNYAGVFENPAYTSALIDELNAAAGRDDAFGFCLDTGHLNLLHDDFRMIVPVLGKRIKALHIHDNNGTHDEHMAPLTGSVNWHHFCSSLKDAGYEGDLDFETFHQTNVVMDFDFDLLIPWMKLIADTGKCFRKRITE